MNTRTSRATRIGLLAAAGMALIGLGTACTSGSPNPDQPTKPIAPTATMAAPRQKPAPIYCHVRKADCQRASKELAATGYTVKRIDTDGRTVYASVDFGKCVIKLNVNLSDRPATLHQQRAKSWPITPNLPEEGRISLCEGNKE